MKSFFFFVGATIFLSVLRSSSSLDGLDSFVPHKNGDKLFFQVANNSALYPEWAHHHWVWLDHHRENADSEIEFVKGFLSRGIPVGAVNIDSEWSTGINNFVWDKSKFPDPKGMIDYFHSLNIRVTCWATSMIDLDSPNYHEGYEKGYYLEGGLIAKWWHGVGSFIDYTNPDALDWWHKQMDQVIDIGIDGWKCDGTDAILFEWGGIAKSYSGFITEREYADMYYRDFFHYTRKKNPNALIMSRPVDSWEIIYLSFSPRDVVFSGWVGDQDPTFLGLQDALRNMFHSAWRNYLNFGSDTGGYRSGNRTKELFIRWSQLSAFCPLFENGGEGKHAPWSYDNETTTIYRNFVQTHMELNPFFLSTGTESYQKGISVMHPLAEETIFQPSRWDYLLGDDILVVPMVEPGNKRKVDFPEGNEWIDFWSNKTFQGGTSITMDVPLDTYPVFRRKGSIIPMRVAHKDSPFGNEHSLGVLTVVINSLVSGYHQKKVFEWKNTGINVAYEYDSSSKKMHFTASSYHSPIIVLIENVEASSTEIWNHLSGGVLQQVISNSCNEKLEEKKEGWCQTNNRLILRFDEMRSGVHLEMIGLTMTS